MENVPEKFSFDGLLKLKPVSAERLETFNKLYKHLQLICDSDYRRQYPNSGKNFTTNSDLDWLQYIKDRSRDEFNLIEDTADYYRVRALWDNVMTQIAKCDVQPIVPENEFMDRTMRLCHSFFKFIRSSPSHQKDEHDYDLGTSPGVPLNKLRPSVRTKREALRNFYDLVMKWVFDLDYPSIDAYNDKDELLDISDLLRDKIRGIFGSPLHGVIREKYLYGNQNKKILHNFMNGWIKYGLVKQYGGFSRAIKSLEKFPFIWESDVSGYDRHIFLGKVYELRNANIDDPSGLYKDLVEVVTENNVRPVVLLPNGYVVKRLTGNDSGKNNTTVDNSISHFIIMIYMFCKQLMLHGHKPTLSYIFENCELLIYSDDKIGGMFLDAFYWESPQQFLDFEKTVYAEFGLECKVASQVFTVKAVGDRVPKDHSFLGSYCHYDEQSCMYIPYPRMGKICSSIVRKYSIKDIETRFMRYLNLCINCYPNPDIFRQSMKFLSWYYNKNLEFSYIFDEILNECDLDFQAISTFKTVYLGFETKIKRQDGFQGAVPLRTQDRVNNGQASVLLFLHFLVGHCFLKLGGGRFLKKQMTSTVFRGEKTLQRIVNVSQRRSQGAESGIHGLTTDGKQFVVQTVDPKHDLPFHQIVGWPDANSNPSLRYLVKYQMAIAAPTGTVAPWDLHIASIPVTDIMPYIQTTTRSDSTFTYNGSAASATFGGVVARGVPTGTPVTWIPAAGSVSIVGQQGLDTVYQTGLSRVIAHGFEVRDTSAAINRQGACTVYCQSEQRADPVTFTGITTSVASPNSSYFMISGTPMRLPPTTVAQAMLYPDSRQWKSEEGSYHVARFMNLENPACQPIHDVPMWYTNTSDQANSYGTGGFVANTFPLILPVSASGVSNTVTIAATNVTTSFSGMPATKIHNYHISGAIYTGLNPNSTFVVDIVWIVETFPGPAESDKLVLATPSCGFDPTALDIMAHVIADMPVAVKAGENFAGGWFDAIVDKVAEYAGPLGAAIGTIVPGASLLGQGLSIGAKALQSNRAQLGNNVVKGPVLMQPTTKNKRKKIKKKNTMLKQGNRGKSGRIQGPVNKPKLPKRP